MVRQYEKSVENTQKSVFMNRIFLISYLYHTDRYHLENPTSRIEKKCNELVEAINHAKEVKKELAKYKRELEKLEKEELKNECVEQA